MTVISVQSGRKELFLKSNEGFVSFTEDLQAATRFESSEHAQNIRESKFFQNALAEKFRQCKVSLVPVRITVERIENAISD